LFSAPLINPAGDREEDSKVKAVEELSYHGERETLLKTLASSGKHVRFISEAANKEAATSASLARACRIFHFTGHGKPGMLTLEDSIGQLQYSDEEDLLAMLEIPPHHSGLRLVFLSACHSESVAHCFVRA
ncbi:unnamed protein product, partial [Discosporangium mesarthrocarpum]